MPANIRRRFPMIILSTCQHHKARGRTGSYDRYADGQPRAGADMADRYGWSPRSDVRFGSLVPCVGSLRARFGLSNFDVAVGILLSELQPDLQSFDKAEMLRRCYPVDLNEIFVAGSDTDEVVLHEKSPFVRQPSH